MKQAFRVQLIVFTDTSYPKPVQPHEIDALGLYCGVPCQKHLDSVVEIDPTDESKFIGKKTLMISLHTK